MPGCKLQPRNPPSRGISNQDPLPCGALLLRNTTQNALCTDGQGTHGKDTHGKDEAWPSLSHHLRIESTKHASEWPHSHS